LSNRKRELLQRLVFEVRASQNATDRFDQAVADTLGINRTDMRCLDILERVGRLTAGRLAAETGLTSGAITTAIDRLERAGHVRRIRDTDDRRRVYVEITEETRRLANSFYSEHAALGESLSRRYSEQELELLLEFVQRGREFNDRKAAELEAQLEAHRTAADRRPGGR
jgi:DNA-binding MarR family transcriptional regulator